MKKPAFLSTPKDTLRQRLLQDHMFGSEEKKCRAYENPCFPEEMLLGIALQAVDKKNNKILGSVISNSNFPAEELLKQAESSLRPWSQKTLKNHTNNSAVLEKVKLSINEKLKNLDQMFFSEESILPLLTTQSIVAGNGVRHLINKHRDTAGYFSEENDLDIFLKSADAFKKVFALVLKEFNVKEEFSLSETRHGLEIGIKEIFSKSIREKNGSDISIKKLEITENAVTVSFEESLKKDHDSKIKSKSKKFQFIAKVLKEDPKDLVNTFDFAHCKAYYLPFSSGVVMSESTRQSIHYNKIIFEGGISPLGAMYRLQKFVHQGMRINKVEMLKATLHIQTFDLSNPEVLEEMLAGYYDKKPQYPEISQVKESLSQEELSSLLMYLSQKHPRN